MNEPGGDWPFRVTRSDADLLRSMGIAASPDPYPEPLPAPRVRQRRNGIAGNEAVWLKRSRVPWKPEPAFQLPLGFCCGNRETAQEAYTFAEARMKKECSSCHGTGKCPQCRGTGRLGYPGYGQVETYRTPCIACQESGVCRVCRGTGQK